MQTHEYYWWVHIHHRDACMCHLQTSDLEHYLSAAPILSIIITSCRSQLCLRLTQLTSADISWHVNLAASVAMRLRMYYVLCNSSWTVQDQSTPKIKATQLHSTLQCAHPMAAPVTKDTTCAPRLWLIQLCILPPYTSGPGNQHITLELMSQISQWLLKEFVCFIFTCCIRALSKVVYKN